MDQSMLDAPWIMDKFGAGWLILRADREVIETVYDLDVAARIVRDHNELLARKDKADEVSKLLFSEYCARKDGRTVISEDGSAEGLQPWLDDGYQLYSRQLVTASTPWEATDPSTVL